MFCQSLENAFVADEINIKKKNNVILKKKNLSIVHLTDLHIPVHYAMRLKLMIFVYVKKRKKKKN